MLVRSETFTDGRLPSFVAWSGRDQDGVDAVLQHCREKNAFVFRKERFLFPINEEYDLYSCGRDGDSEPGLSAPVSQDDIIRANDGAFIGRASEF